MIYFYYFIGIIIFFVVIGIPLTIISDRRRNRNLEKVFGGRQELDESDFYEKYFEKKEVPFFVVKKIRQILEEVLDADLSRLSAEDDFSKNLNFFWQDDSLADEEMLDILEDEFDIKFDQSDFDRIETFSINNIVNLVWNKIRKKNELSNQES